MLYAVCVACCDSCLIYYVFSRAFVLQWACVLNPTIATVGCAFAMWLVFPKYACIVFGDQGLHIVHATVTDLNCVSVENFVKFVARWEMLVN